MLPLAEQVSLIVAFFETPFKRKVALPVTVAPEHLLVFLVHSHPEFADAEHEERIALAVVPS